MQHLQDTEQTYYQHWKNSMSYFCKSCKASLYFFIHAFIPCVFTSSGSDTVKELLANIESR